MIETSNSKINYSFTAEPCENCTLMIPSKKLITMRHSGLKFCKKCHKGLGFNGNH